MTQDEIIAMAEQAGVLVTIDEGGMWVMTTPGNKRQVLEFAALVAAHEREACAKVCDELQWYSAPINFAENCAKAIRARGEK